jgi:rare lipoprotein A
VKRRSARLLAPTAVVVLLLGACAPAPKYVNRPRGAGATSGGRTGTATTGRPETPARLPARAPSGRVPDGPERWGDHYLRGSASYYGREFHGRKTANGDIFDMYKLTAAHRTLPLGTRARIWNLENGRSCVVIINDRGPFIEGRILDLSYAAALELEMVTQGVAQVQIEILELPPEPWWW